jgi:hypothetical protein
MGKALPSGYPTGMTPRNKARQLPSRCAGEQRGVNALGQVSWRGCLQRLSQHRSSARRMSDAG